MQRQPRAIDVLRHTTQWRQFQLDQIRPRSAP